MRGTQQGGDCRRAQSSVIWPPDLPAAHATSTTVITGSGYVHVGEIIAAVATLNLAELNQSARDVPSLQPTIALLGHIDWPAACSQAIRMQRVMLAATRGPHRALRLDRHWPLEKFLSGHPNHSAG